MRLCLNCWNRELSKSWQSAEGLRWLHSIHRRSQASRLQVISVKKEASKPYPTRETPLTGDFDVELDNTGGSTEKSFTKSRTVEATSSQTYSVESGTSSSFTVGASVSAEFESLGAEFSVELSTEYSTSGFYNSGYQKTSQEKITTAFQITSKVPAGVRTIARFSKRTEPLTLKWGATIHAEGEIKLSYTFAKFGHRIRTNETVIVSLSQVGGGKTSPLSSNPPNFRTLRRQADQRYTEP